MAKKLTPEQRARKNARQRETYGQAKSAGFSRNQARSIEKTLRNAPEILQEPTKELLGLVGGIRKFSKWLVEETIESTKPEPKSKAKKRQEHRPTNDPFIETLQGLSKWLLPDGKQIIPSFDIFASQYPDLSARKVMEKYKNFGGKIGSQKGNAIIRDLRGLELNRKKITRFKEDQDDYEYDNDIFGGGGSKIVDYDFVAPNKNFTKHKDRYMYLLGYDVVNKEGLVFRRYIHIPSSIPLSLEELESEVDDYWAEEVDSNDEKYAQVEFVEGSVYLIEAYDLWLKGA